ncbi:unnamed protein product [Rhodiola kirilowii]
MAGRASQRCVFGSLVSVLLLPVVSLVLCPIFGIGGGGFVLADQNGDEAFLLAVHGDYSPPSPPSPSMPPHPSSLSCERDLNGVGSLDSTCSIGSNLNFSDNVYIQGSGSLNILPGVNVTCHFKDCAILVYLKGDFVVSENVMIAAGTLYVNASNASFLQGSVVNVTGLAGDPPAESSGTPSGIQGAGGGHGGRGANCLVDNTKLPEEVWGGDTYAWATLNAPFEYGSPGGSTSREERFGGGGGGRITFLITYEIDISGTFLAEGGNGGIKGGGGSGGSIYIKAHRMTGKGSLSASGGDGFAGGGGGRISVDVYGRHDNLKIYGHGGRSYGCPENAGAAGTYYDAVPRRLIVSNNNFSTTTDTLLLDFPNHPLWTNVYIEDCARACIPLLWTRVQVQGQLRLSSGAVLSFGHVHFSPSEFELMAEELLMSDSVVEASYNPLTVHGALRMTVKIHLMWNSKMQIYGGDDPIVANSLLEASNLMVLKESSVIHSNANLGVHGQGFLNLSGPGDIIEAQRLILSLFSCISVGPGSVLRGPLENASENDITPRLYCDLQGCPLELLHPPEDCNMNSSLAFTLQICRVEDIVVEGLLTGSVVHMHWVRDVTVHSSGTITTSKLGCKGGLGRGKVLSNGLGSGAGHGGKGGDGYYNGSFFEGGASYGDADLPCELGSGSGSADLAGTTAGGGIIVMGSLARSLSSLTVDGSLRADGQSNAEYTKPQDNSIISEIGPGGGSGGTILVFVHSLILGEFSVISTFGGHGSPFGGGGGAGGRIHFHWSGIMEGDEYLPVATVKGTIHTGGGLGRGRGHDGENGTITGKACPKGLYGIFCEECPVGTFKNTVGSDRTLCRECPLNELPQRAIYVAVRGGVAETPCPYECISERYHLPHCYTALEELINTFGGPWLFGFILLGFLILSALVLSVARTKLVGAEELQTAVPPRRVSRIDSSFPFLESLNEVLETNRAEESHSHVHRIYFMGPNTFNEPWHLPHSPPAQLLEIVYEDAFNRFVDEINDLAAYQWWEGSVHSLLSVVAFPLAWSWLQRCRKQKLQRLREFVRSEYDHSCLRSCRSRALYEGIKVAATPGLGYVDFFLGGDEKRTDLPPTLKQRFPLWLIFEGDGSYIAPFSLQSDNILTSLISQSVPPTIWYRLVAGLNAQLRLVRHEHLNLMFGPIIHWLDIYANPTICSYGVRVDLAWFQPTTFSYYQYGLLVTSTEIRESRPPAADRDKSFSSKRRTRGNTQDQPSVTEQLLTCKASYGIVQHAKNLQMLKLKKALYWPLFFVLHNTKPIGHQDLVGLVMSILLLGDFSLVLLTLLQLYSISLLDFLLVLWILPLGILFPFPAGIRALFSHGPRRAANLARIYAIWNVISMTNVVVAFVCGWYHYKTHASNNHLNFQSWSFSMDESEWWMLPSGLMLCKVVQSRLIQYHVANQEIQDYSLYSNDPTQFWQQS